MFFRIRLAQVTGPTTADAFPTALKKKKAFALGKVVNQLPHESGFQRTGDLELQYRR
jgi:hypothetical protein